MTSPTYWPKAKKHLSAVDPVMKKIIAPYKGETLVSRGDAFFTLARSIVGQQISVKAADSVWKKLMSACDTFPPPAGGLRGENVPPPTTLTPKGVSSVALPRRRGRYIIAQLPDEHLRACGLSGQKVKYLRSLCEYFEIERNFSHLSDEEVIAELTTIKGIGRWTAEMFLIFHLLRPNVLPLDDIGLQKAVYRHYFEGTKVDRKRITTLAKAWEPYRSVATWYLWRSLDPVVVEY